jgi:hypothetical protein
MVTLQNNNKSMGHLHDDCVKTCITNKEIGHGTIGKQKYQHIKPNVVVIRKDEKP